MPRSHTPTDHLTPRTKTVYSIFKGGSHITENDDTPNWTIPDAQKIGEVVSTARTSEHRDIVVFLTKSWDEGRVPNIVENVVEQYDLKEISREHWSDGSVKCIRYRCP